MKTNTHHCAYAPSAVRTIDRRYRQKDDEWHESNELGSTRFSSYSQTSKTRLYDYPPPLPHSSHSWRSFIYDTEGCAA